MSKTIKNIPELRFPEYVNDGEWKERKLGDIGEFIGGGTPNTTIEEYWDGEILWYTPTEVKDGVLRDSSRKITEEGLKNSSAKILPIGTILITTRATLGDAAITTNLCCTNQGFQSLHVNDSENNIFWYYWIIGNKVELLKKASGSTFKEIGKNEIVKIIALSPRNIKEQQKIASCLSSLDELITGEEQRLELLTEHKKGLMQNLFLNPSASSGDETIPKYRFPEFEKDGEWEENELGTISDVSKLAGYEFTKHIEYQDSGEIIALRGLNIKNNKLELSDVKYVDNSDFSKLGRSKLYIDDMMFTYIGTIGEVALIKENDKYYLAPNVSRIRPDKSKVIPHFLLQYFNNQNFKQYEISKYISSSSQPALTMANVRKFIIKLPPTLQEQQKIASCLSSLDELIQAQTGRIEELKEHKKGLMQKLFPQLTK